MELNVSQLRPHPLNERIYGTEPLDDLLESIKKHGIIEPLVVKLDGTIISGHRRWRAAQALGMTALPCRFVSYEDCLAEKEAIVEFNRQRVKTFSQKMAEAEVLKEIESERARRRMSIAAQAQKQGGETFPHPDEAGRTRDRVASFVGLGSGRNYSKAEKVWTAAKQGDETAKMLVEKLDKGETTINAAYNHISLALKKEQAAAAPERTEAPAGVYDVIVVSPRWIHEERAAGAPRRGRNPYMTVEEIKGLKLPAAEDCVIWLWTENAFLHDAFHVLEAWGFTPKNILTWVKNRSWYVYGPFNDFTEHCILAAKGKPAASDSLTIRTKVFHASERRVNRKPDEFYQLVESLCPGRKLVMFTKNSRSGWDVYEGKSSPGARSRKKDQNTA